MSDPLYGMRLDREDFLEEASLRDLAKAEQDTTGPRRVKASRCKALRTHDHLKDMK